MNKNDNYIIEITDFTSNGEGIGRADDFPLFVKDAIIGDKVLVKVIKVKKTYGYARLLEIIEPSSDRVEPECPQAKRCGGCQIQTLSYDKQLEFKQKLVRDNLSRIGGIDNFDIEPIVGMEHPFRFRNKEQFPIRRNKDGKIVAGFFAGRTHSLIEIDDCKVSMPVMKEIMDAVLAVANKYNVEPYDEENHSGILRHVLLRYGFYSKQIMVCFVINSNKLPYSDEFINILADIDGVHSICININKKKTNVILGDKTITLWGKDYIEDQILGLTFNISPVSFYQVNPTQMQKLYSIALEYANLTGDEIVWDLYCGIGTISLCMAQRAKWVYGVEIVERAIEDAKINAIKNNITNVEFMAGKAEEVVPRFYENNSQKPDVIVVDPPRKGCDKKLLETISSIEPDRIVYVSCNPSTLARDVKYLKENGYNLVKCRAVDQFGHTTHVETVENLTHMCT